MMSMMSQEGLNQSMMTEQPNNDKKGRLSMGGVEMGMEDLTTFNSTVAYSRPTSVPARFL